jgi:hypothetical protein
MPRRWYRYRTPPRLSAIGYRLSAIGYYTRSVSPHQLQRDLRLQAGGEIDVRAAGGRAGLDGDGGNFRVDVFDADPDIPLVDAAFDGLHEIALTVEDAFADQHAVSLDDRLGGIEDFVDGTFIAPFERVLDERHPGSLPIGHGINATRREDRQGCESCEEFQICFHWGNAITFNRGVKHEGWADGVME